MDDDDTPKHPVSFYGKKVYYINPLIAKKALPTKKEPEQRYEDVEKDEDK